MKNELKVESPVQKRLRLENLEERQLLTAVGLIDAPCVSESAPVVCEASAVEESPVIDLSAVALGAEEKQDPATTGNTWTVTSRLDDGSEGTLRYAIENASDGDKIEFSAETFKRSRTITLTNGQLEINASITIDASAISQGVTINAGGNSRIMYVNAGTVEDPIALTLKGLTFTRGYAEGDKGGAIYNKGTLTVDGVKFTNNKADLNGGAIFNDTDATLTVDGGSFSGNYAKNGGWCANYGHVTISGERTSIKNNSASLLGGAYFGCGILNIEAETSFSNNSVTAGGSKGGAIYNGVRKVDGSVVSVGEVTITGDVTFAGNKAIERGGAIVSYGTLTIKPDTGNAVVFRSNGAGGEVDGDTYVGYGGALDVGQGSETKLGGTLKFGLSGMPNTAGFGGAIFACGESLTFDESGEYLFRYNEADNGGAIANSGCSSLTLPDVLMKGNVAKNGGAVFNDVNATLTVVDGTFADNFASENGGAFVNCGEMKISGETSVKIEGNHATNCGGAYSGYGTLSVTGVVDFVGNYVDAENSQGGAIYTYALIEGGATMRTGVVSITGSVSFVNNSASYAGGAIMSYSKLTIRPKSGNSVIFVNNNGGEGGTIDLGEGGTTSFGGDVTIVGAAEESDGSSFSPSSSKSAVQVELDVVFAEPEDLLGEF